MAETRNVEDGSIEKGNLNIKLALCGDPPSFSANCIFKVPRTLRRHNEIVFYPNIVSIGPFHRGNTRLAPLEKIKLWYLRCLLQRFPESPEEDLDNLVNSIGELQKRARECYAEPIDDLDDPKFVEMMVVDGCFLIELFRKEAELVPCHPDDPIFRTSWMLENLYHDLILLENQIPWFVLQKLFELTVQRQETGSLVELVVGFFKKRMLIVETSPGTESRRISAGEIKHILDLLYHRLVSSAPQIICRSAGWQRLPPVTDLLQAGIEFKMGDPSQIFNIEFQNGVFKIPPISIQSNSESLFRNLIAYEQHDRDSKLIFTSYAVFLDYLINTAKDVDVLSDEGILQHALSTEDVSLLFNRLYNDTLVYNFYYGDVSRQVYKYYKSRWPKWRTTFKREYCKNPWTISSVIAAGLILLFTFTQALSSIFDIIFGGGG